jgi:hypothetical protein
VPWHGYRLDPERVTVRMMGTEIMDARRGRSRHSGLRMGRAS